MSFKFLHQFEYVIRTVCLLGYKIDIPVKEKCKNHTLTTNENDSEIGNHEMSKMILKSVVIWV